MQGVGQSLVVMHAQDIAAGEELLYDYGERAQFAVAQCPWLEK